MGHWIVWVKGIQSVSVMESQEKSLFSKACSRVKLRHEIYMEDYGYLEMHSLCVF